MVLYALAINGRVWFSWFYQDPFEKAMIFETKEVLRETIEPSIIVEVMDLERNTLDEDMAADVNDMVFSEEND